MNERVKDEEANIVKWIKYGAFHMLLWARGEANIVRQSFGDKNKSTLS